MAMDTIGATRPKTSEVGVTKSRKVLVYSQRTHSDRPSRSSATVNEGARTKAARSSAFRDFRSRPRLFWV